ncbi:MAG: peptidylprolyl isomerase [Candidatus Amesbacteria bacterium]|nr:peptidylprolyl isomerase [Candidatus Amesbacteria bacterium]
MDENNRYLVAGVIVVILVIIAGVLISKKFTNKSLPTGKVETASPSGTPTNNTMNTNFRPQVKINTSKGEFVIELRPDLAPKTVANFLSKFNAGYCNNLTWHRVEDWVVQGCDPLGNGTGGKSDLATETSAEPFVVGSVGVARKEFPKEYSNDSQFFITKKDSQFLNNEYTYFGKVISGMDVVNKLAIGDLFLDTTTLTK